MAERISDRERMRIAAQLSAEGTDPNAPGGTAMDAAMFAAGPIGSAVGRLGPKAVAALMAGPSFLMPSEVNSQASLTRAQQRQLEMEQRRQQIEAEGRRRAEDDKLNADIKRKGAEAEQDRITQQLERELQEKIANEERNKTFVQKYPGIADALPGIGLGIAAAVPAAGRVLSQRARNAPMREWHATVRETEDALGRTNWLGQPRPDARAAGDGTAKLAEFNATFPKGEMKPPRELPTWQPSKGMVASGMFGGSVAAEAGMFPDQWNAINLPHDNPERAASRDRALDWTEYVKRGFMGALTGASGYKAGGMMYPDIRGPVEASKGLVGRYGTTPDQVNAALGSIAKGPSQTPTTASQTSRQISSVSKPDTPGSQTVLPPEGPALLPPPVAGASRGGRGFPLTKSEEQELRQRILDMLMK